MGFNVTQVYGLTEVYGPATECTWDSTWDDLGTDERASIKARQGVAMPFMEDVAVWDSDGQQISRDGTAQGEIVMRGNGTMKGYYKNPKATAEAFEGGYFHSGRYRCSPSKYLCSNRRPRQGHHHFRGRKHKFG